MNFPVPVLAERVEPEAPCNRNQQRGEARESTTNSHRVTVDDSRGGETF